MTTNAKRAWKIVDEPIGMVVQSNPEWLREDIEKALDDAHQRGKDEQLEATKLAIAAEPELPGKMPNDLWRSLKGLIVHNQRDEMLRVLRSVAIGIKKGILERLE